MTLEEFVEQTKKELDTFAKKWRKGHKEQPEQWPLEMNEGDWYDQFLMYEEGSDKE